MKAYEQPWRSVLPRRLPVIIRVDGRAFHTFTRGCEKPFDARLGDTMVSAARDLCDDIQGAQFAYTQSDEISVLVHSYKRFESQAWFDNQVQKMCSVSASIAAARLTLEYGKAATFDARVFVLPEDDVCNYFVWRQQDAVRNSVNALAQSLYSHKDLFGVSQSQAQELCFAKGQNWNDLPTRWKRGVGLYRTTGGTWLPSYEIPTFSQEREYIERHLAKVDA